MLQAGGSARGARNGRTVSCPRCAATCAIDKHEHGYAAACSGCGGTYIDRALLAWAESAVAKPIEVREPPTPPPAAEPALPPATPAESGPDTAAGAPPRVAVRRKALLALAGVTVVLVVAALTKVAWSAARPGPPPISDLAWKTAPLALPSVESRRPDSGAPPVLAAQTKPSAVQPAATATKPPTPPPVERLFGGRPLEWWKARLVRLKKAGSSAPLYEATLRAARANGLVASEAGDDVTVTLPAQEPLRAEAR